MGRALERIRRRCPTTTSDTAIRSIAQVARWKSHPNGLTEAVTVTDRRWTPSVELDGMASSEHPAGARVRRWAQSERAIDGGRRPLAGTGSETEDEGLLNLAGAGAHAIEFIAFGPVHPG